MKALGLLLFAISSVAQISSSAPQDGLKVQTKQGFVAGTFTTPNVRQFLGIPYASVVRWELPHPPFSRNYTLEAKQFGDSCIPNFGGTLGASDPVTGQTAKESEDCLNLNIWGPALDRPQNTSVMIWIYGGSFQFGSSNDPFNQGQPFVENHDDVVLVTFNYRTNIFGFPGAPQLVNQSRSQNFGALDVDAAIQWVFDNIASFGGDPNRITIFGESAGSALVAAFTFAHPNDTRVKGAIQQSGSFVRLPTNLTSFGARFNAKAWNNVVKMVKCERLNLDAQLSCMKDVSARDLRRAVEKMKYPTFVPVQDNITFFTDFSSRSVAGNFLKVPLLVGNTKDEADVPGKNIELPPPYVLPFTAFIKLITKAIFACPAGRTADDRVKEGVPTFRYRYDAVFPNTFNRSSAFHSSDVPIVFGTANFSEFGPTTGVEDELSAFVQSAWVAFARDPSKGPTNLGWPRYTPGTNTLAILGNSTLNATGISFTSGKSYDSGCQAAEVVANTITDLIHNILDTWF